MKSPITGEVCLGCGRLMVVSDCGNTCAKCRGEEDLPAIDTFAGAAASSSNPASGSTPDARIHFAAASHRDTGAGAASPDAATVALRVSGPQGTLI